MTNASDSHMCRKICVWMLELTMDIKKKRSVFKLHKEHSCGALCLKVCLSVPSKSLKTHVSFFCEMAVSSHTGGDSESEVHTK